MFKSNYLYVICARCSDGSIIDVYYADDAIMLKLWEKNMPTLEEMYENNIHAYYVGTDFDRKGNFKDWRII